MSVPVAHMNAVAVRGVAQCHAAAVHAGARSFGHAEAAAFVQAGARVGTVAPGRGSHRTRVSEMRIAAAGAARRPGLLAVGRPEWGTRVWSSQGGVEFEAAG
jgi:predicted carbohydrate-binding protein with CBM5 and CBM33 domain